eukprot:15451772-Alexandrium_andersonii.AAC.1
MPHNWLASFARRRLEGTGAVATLPVAVLVLGASPHSLLALALVEAPTDEAAVEEARRAPPAGLGETRPFLQTPQA